MFLTITAVILALYLWWGFRVLPGERWQMLATVPKLKNSNGSWQGINYTWYGLLNANAHLMAVAVLLILLGSLGIPTLAIVLLALGILSCCLPAAKIVAYIVEKKSHTFTVGGAVFVGIIITPLVIMMLNRFAGSALGFQIPVIAAWAAIAISYTFGEGLGRLACISFGCCYGKPLNDEKSAIIRFFSGSGFTFYGKTKKIVYADALEAIPVIPVQAMTAILYTTSGLIATALFLSSHQSAAFLTAIITTQTWRIFSETLRADYRGSGKISAYQIMGSTGMLYAVVMSLFMEQTASDVIPQIGEALNLIWQPGVLLFLQGVWLVVFLYTGRSTVTGANLSFHVHHERI